eukprot:GCRY01004978.1.p1 GENE.GCRY01004978.1~~GCRY01004978.1.p1  ORF type:complete len:973 (-),score=344.18 GCRY01004978.1:243-3161(-)
MEKKSEINLKVLVRVRPAITEMESELDQIVEVEPDEKHVSVIAPKPDPQHLGDQRFRFDNVLPPECTQDQVFDTIRCSELIRQMFDGFSTTIFCYGKTGSGKTYTMMGKEGKLHRSTRAHWGLVPRIMQYLFDSVAIQKEENPQAKYKLTCQFIEIYNEQVRDLLRNKRNKPEDLKIMSERVVGAKVPELTSFTEAMEFLRHGLGNRQTDSTRSNEVSSRSHAIFSVTLSCTYNLIIKGEAVPQHVNSELQFVDLAGMETLKMSLTKQNTEVLSLSASSPSRGISPSSTSTPELSPQTSPRKLQKLSTEYELQTGERRKLREMTKINQSLSCLMQVMDMLSDPWKMAEIQAGRLKIRYRDSKLTHLLKNSLDPTAPVYTIMLANISPYDRAFSLKTLKYADSAKNMKTQPKAEKESNPNTRMLIERRTKQMEALLERLCGLGLLPGGEGEMAKLREALVALNGEKQAVGSEVEKISVALEQSDEAVKFLVRTLQDHGILESLFTALGRMTDTNIKTLKRIDDDMHGIGGEVGEISVFTRHYIQLLNKLAETPIDEASPWAAMHKVAHLLECLRGSVVDQFSSQLKALALARARVDVLRKEEKRFDAMLQEALSQAGAVGLQSDKPEECKDPQHARIAADIQAIRQDLEILEKALKQAVETQEYLAAECQTSRGEGEGEGEGEEAKDADRILQQGPAYQEVVVGTSHYIAGLITAASVTVEGKLAGPDRFGPLLDPFDADASEFPPLSSYMLQSLAITERVREGAFSQLNTQIEQLRAEKKGLEARVAELDHLAKMNKGDFITQLEEQNTLIGSLRDETASQKTSITQLTQTRDLLLSQLDQATLSFNESELRNRALKGVRCQKVCRKMKKGVPLVLPRVVYCSPQLSHVLWRKDTGKALFDVDNDMKEKRCLPLSTVTKISHNLDTSASTQVFEITFQSSKRDLVIQLANEDELLDVFKAFSHVFSQYQKQH